MERITSALNLSSSKSPPAGSGNALKPFLTSSSLGTNGLSPTEADFDLSDSPYRRERDINRERARGGGPGRAGYRNNDGAGFIGIDRARTEKEERLRNGEFEYIWDDPRSAWYSRGHGKNWPGGVGGSTAGSSSDGGTSSGYVDPPTSAKTLGSWPSGGSRTNAPYASTTKQATSSSELLPDSSWTGSHAYDLSSLSLSSTRSLPDQAVRAILYGSTPALPPSTRRNYNPRPSSSSSAPSSFGAEGRPLNLKAMARGPPGSGAVVVGGSSSAMTTSPAVSSSFGSASSGDASGGGSLRVLRVGNDFVPDPTGVIPSSLEGRIGKGKSRMERESPLSSSTSSRSPGNARNLIESSRLLATGPGGMKLEQVLDLWKDPRNTGALGGGGNMGGVAVKSVDWGKGAYSNKIIAACSTGSCLLFDLQKGFEREISGPQARPMLCAAFNPDPHQPYLALTADAEGLVKLWDTRAKNDKTIRQHRHSVSVLSICFAPPDVSESSKCSYVVGLDNGTICRYDWRATGSTGRYGAAHGSKGVTALEWKGPGEHRSINLEAEEDQDDGQDDGRVMPGSGGWLASAGMDRTVNIWDMSIIEGAKIKPVRTLHTSHGIRRIAWRPHHETELAVVSVNEGIISGTMFGQCASISLEGPVGDVSEESRLEIWDVRRAHVAKYILGNAARHGASAVVQDISWAENGALQSCYSNGTFEQHDIRGHFRPLDNLPRQAGAWNAKGEFAFAIDRCLKGEIPFDDVKPEYQDRMSEYGARPKTITDSDHVIRQEVATVETDESDDQAWIYAAKQYCLTGAPAADLCTWNAEVDEVIGRENYMHLWLLLRQLLEASTKAEVSLAQTDQSAKPVRGTPFRTDSSRTILPKRWPQREDNASQPHSLAHQDLADDSSSSSRDDPRDRRGSSSSSSSDSEAGSGAGMMSSTWKSSTIGRHRPSALSIASVPPTLTAPSSQMPTPRGNFFGSSATPPATNLSAFLDAPHKPTADSERPAVLPQSGKTVTSRVSPRMMADQRRGSLVPTTHPLPSEVANKNAERARASIAIAKLSQERERKMAFLKMQRGFLAASLERLLESGELQIAACMLAVGPSEIPLAAPRVERITFGYLDLLSRYRLFACAADVRRSHAAAALVTLSETIFHTKCSSCRQAVELPASQGSISAPYCQNCQKAIMSCGICRLPVHSLQIACMQCGHGGHEACISTFLVQVRSGKYAEASRLATPATASRNPSPIGARTESPTRLQRQFGERMRDRSTSSTRALRIAASPKPEISMGIPCFSGCGCRCWAHGNDFAVAVDMLR